MLIDVTAVPRITIACLGIPATRWSIESANLPEWLENSVPRALQEGIVRFFFKMTKHLKFQVKVQSSEFNQQTR